VNLFSRWFLLSCTSQLGVSASFVVVLYVQKSWIDQIGDMAKLLHFRSESDTCVSLLGGNITTGYPLIPQPPQLRWLALILLDSTVSGLGLNTQGQVLDRTSWPHRSGSPSNQ
jgi:hypothetical protein